MINELYIYIWPWGGARKKNPVADFYILKDQESRIGIQGCIEGVVFFTRVTGGAGGAAGNGGVPVLQGLGGGSATGVLFQRLVWFAARVIETSRNEVPEMCPLSCFFFFCLSVVQFLARSWVDCNCEIVGNE